MFIPGYVKTNKFQVMLGNGNDHAANLTYNISGDASTSNVAKTYTIEGLTGSPTVELKVYNLSASTQYYVKDTNVSAGGSSITTSTTDSSGTLTYSATLGSTHQYDIYKELATSTSGSSSSTSQSSSSPSAPSCSDQVPGSKAPWLYAAIPKSSNSVLLYFAEADGPLDSYALQFGTKSGDYPYGSTNIGGKETRTYLVQSLSPNTTYYFRVRAGNGCATGPWSNEISVKTKGFISLNQLETSEFKLEPALPSDNTLNTCQSYTVESGDNLWSIAAEQMGDGSKFQEIIDENNATYPSLSSSTNLKVGWELQLNCKPAQVEEEKKEVDGQGGYILNVKVTDKTQQPVAGAKVTIHSKVQEAITDENGFARFENVEAGDHQVLVAYEGYEGEQSVNLTGETKEFNLSITLEMKNLLLSRLVLGIIGFMGLVIIFLLVLLWRARSKKAK